jgi:chromosome segregation ATPase
VCDEHEKHTQKLVAEHEVEIQQIRAEFEKQIQQINADNSASMQQFASSHEELETVTQKLDTNLKKSEEHNRSLMKELQQSQASKNTVVTGLQHEIELLRQQLANTEATVQTERGHLSELRKDNAAEAARTRDASVACAKGRVLEPDFRWQKERELGFFGEWINHSRYSPVVVPCVQLRRSKPYCLSIVALLRISITSLCPYFDPSSTVTTQAFLFYLRNRSGSKS